MERVIKTCHLAVVLFTIVFGQADWCQAQATWQSSATRTVQNMGAVAGDFSAPYAAQSPNHDSPLSSLVQVDWLDGALEPWTGRRRIIRAQNNDPSEFVELSDTVQLDHTSVSPISHGNWVHESACGSACDCGCENGYGCGCESGCPLNFRLSEFNIYPTFSYLGTLSATYTEFEFASHMDLGPFEMENRTVMNVADLPGEIALGPTSSGDTKSKTGIRENGFGDVLSGFFFSLKDHHAHWHLGIGPVLTFPTASHQILGSDQYTAGPGAHFSTELGQLTAGFFVWQSWEISGFESGKRVNQLFGKPFIIYECTDDWHLVYIPLGMSHSWDAKSGDDWTVPVGGGIRKLCDFGGHKVGLQCQAFDYVARKSKDPEWELRFTIEFIFDDA